MEIKALEKRGIENPKMVLHNVHHLQHAILELRNDFVVQQQTGSGKEAAQKRLMQAIGKNSLNYGVREGYGSIKQYFKEAVQKDNVEKFYLQANMFDHRLESLTDTFRYYDGKPAPQFLAGKN